MNVPVLPTIGNLAGVFALVCCLPEDAGFFL
jgi:hypothetical protein